MMYKNPVIAGFHPDPSVCKVGEDYYLVNSSFEYFPGLPIFHSKNLVEWTQIGHCISRNEQLALLKGVPNCTGLYAPTIRYHDGVFYVICTNVAYGEKDEGNFIIWTRDPAGDWSMPIKVDMPGIDPSLFWDDDGKVYYTGAYGSIVLNEINPMTGELIGETISIWEGTGGNDPEGPHIYKKDGWYYLFISEGGTEYGHMVTVARSKQITGPYESCPHNPVLTNRSTSLPIKAVGHADIIEGKNGRWWAVCHGIRPICYPFKHNLGRETMLAPVTWNDEGWPILGEQGRLLEEITLQEVEIETQMITKENANVLQDNFKGSEFNYNWNFIYNPVEELYGLGENGLTLYGNEVALSEAKPLAWIGTRQEYHDCVARTKVEFERMQDKEEAGLSIYLNHRHHYEVALTRINDVGYIILRRQIGSLWKVEKQIPYDRDDVVLELHCSKEHYSFWYGTSKEELKYLGKGEAEYLTTETGGKFTGNYIALYATGNGNKCRRGANFQWFECFPIQK